jgi:hypothetical protein
MSTLPTFHTGCPPWRADYSQPATRFVVVEMGFDADRMIWYRAEPGTSYSTLWEAQAARERLTDTEPEVRYEIQQRVGAGDFTWVSGHEPEID